MGRHDDSNHPQSVFKDMSEAPDKTIAARLWEQGSGLVAARATMHPDSRASEAVLRRGRLYQAARRQELKGLVRQVRLPSACRSRG